MKRIESRHIDLEKNVSSDVIRLARLASLAARIEPELLRKLRLKILPEADAGTEADLWFSPLIQTSSPLGMMFRPEATSELRKQLSREENRDLLDKAWDVSQSIHESAPPAIRIEEEATYLSLVGARKEDIDKALMPIVAAILEKNNKKTNEGAARWARRTLSRLPQQAQNTNSAKILDIAAASMQGNQFILGKYSPEDIYFVDGLIPQKMERAQVGVRLIGTHPKTKWEFSYPPIDKKNIMIFCTCLAGESCR